MKKLKNTKNQTKSTKTCVVFYFLPFENIFLKTKVVSLKQYNYLNFT
jgi:hypothetical protein